MNIWEVRFTGQSNYHKIPFGGLEVFLLKHTDKLPDNVQEIKVSVLE
jgi:hypothetical protein